MKKLISVFMTVAMLFAFVSCKNDDISETTIPMQSYTEKEEFSSLLYSETETSTLLATSAEIETTKTTEITVENVTAETDPAKWTDEEIVTFYKVASVKSQTRVKSIQKMILKKLSVNDGDGALGIFVDFITPFFVSALEKNSTEIDGITGGYENLAVSDTSSVKAYKDGSYTVVEIALKEQTDGIHADSKSGSVGHAISVVGDISVVEKELPQFKIGFDKADISLKYSNPKLRVKVNKDGIIESGVWSYTVCINIENLRVDAKAVPIGATVDKGYGEVDYIITVG